MEDRFADAKSSVTYFLRKQIELPDCTTIKPGDGGRKSNCSFRNIAACDVKVYRIDLMKFCEADQALGDMSQINLAGIRPLGTRPPSRSATARTTAITRRSWPCR